MKILINFRIFHDGQLVHGDDEDRNFDVDTPESEFTKFDKRTYVDTDNEVKSKDTVKKKKL